MNSWQKTLVSKQTTVREAMRKIDNVGVQIALVVDDAGRLVGTLSDGDVRRALLGGISLDDGVDKAMCTTPTVSRVDQDAKASLETMKRLGLHQMPVVDADGVVAGLRVLADYLAPPERDNWVVIMAGGLGTRLQELTRDRPKPMLPVGSRPLLETIVRNFAAQGFKRFYFAVNYKAEQIVEHFGDGSAMGIEVRYLHERQRLGTAGALSLLPEWPEQPIVVTNADLLAKENFGDLVDAHVAAKATATMAVRHYEMQVPFGVVRADEHGRIHAIEEKPVEQFLVNAGIYVLSPEVRAMVPHDTFFDMPTLFETAVREGARTHCHHMSGYWLDIGRLPDYERANQEFRQVFE